MPIEKESRVAAAIRKRLYKQAAADISGTRVGTLNRFFRACEDILTGEALKWATSAPVGADPKAFRSRKLTPTTIDKYVKVRFAIDERDRIEAETSGEMSIPSGWKGPRRETIASDRDMMDYISERMKTSAPPSAGDPVRLVHRIIDGIENSADQSALRQAMEELHVERAKHVEAKLRLDLVLHVFRTLSGFSFDDVVKDGKIDPTGPLSPGMSAGDRQLMMTLMTRLLDNSFLGQFGLVNRRGRIKMADGDGTDLIFPEELSLLTSLAGVSTD